jgi:hypothetical protein
MSENNYLPEMTMPPPEPEKPIEEPDADPLVSKADDKEGAVKVEIEDRDDTEEERDDTEEEIIEEEEPLPVKRKPKLKNEDIFRTPQIQPIKEPVKEKKKRKPPSQKQLDALAKARENMKKKREEAKKLKEEGKEPPPSKRQQKQEKQVKEVIDKQGQLYTEEQIAKITTNAIEQYEVKRKARKEVKKKRQEEEAQQQQVQRTLNRALGQPDPNDIWSHALSGMYGGV